LVLLRDKKLSVMNLCVFVRRFAPASMQTTNLSVYNERAVTAPPARSPACPRRSSDGGQGLSA
jgi:hypothetical protein